MKEARFIEEVPGDFNFSTYVAGIGYGDDQTYDDVPLIDHRLCKQTAFMLVVSGTTPSYTLRIQLEIAAGGTTQIAIQTVTGITSNKWYLITHNGAYIRAFVDTITDTGTPHDFNLDIYIKKV